MSLRSFCASHQLRTYLFVVLDVDGLEHFEVLLELGDQIQGLRHALVHLLAEDLRVAWGAQFV